MKTSWKPFKSAILLAVLPLLATAAASAQQWISNENPVSVDALPGQAVAASQLSSARMHTVSLNGAGMVEGRIASFATGSDQTSWISGLNIFFVQNGAVVAGTKTAADGTFAVGGLHLGAYSFVAAGENSFAAYGVHVVPGNGTDTVHVMEAAAVTPNIAKVKEILKNELPMEVINQIPEATHQVATKEIVGSNRVRLQGNTLVGHVLPNVGELAAVKGTYVHILRGDQKIAEVQADAKGRFTVQGIEPGVYNFVAVGPTGVAVVSFEAVGQDAVANPVSAIAVDTDEIPVAIQGIGAEVANTDVNMASQTPGQLDTVLTSRQDNGFINNNLDRGFIGDDLGYIPDGNAFPIEYAGQTIGNGGAIGGCSTCGGGAGGGGFGGGGGGGGAGLFGGGRRGLLLAAIAAGIAIPLAVSGNDNNSPGNPDTMSPNK